MPQRVDVWLRHQQRRWMHPDAARYLRPDAVRFLKPGMDVGKVYPALKWLEGKGRSDQTRVPKGKPSSHSNFTAYRAKQVVCYKKQAL